MFGKTVLDIDGEHFEHAIDAAKKAKGADQRHANWTPRT